MAAVELVAQVGIDALVAAVHLRGEDGDQGLPVELVQAEPRRERVQRQPGTGGAGAGAEFLLGSQVGRTEDRVGRPGACGGHEAVDPLQQHGDLTVGDRMRGQVRPVQLRCFALLRGGRGAAGAIERGQPQIQVRHGERGLLHDQPPSSSSRRPCSQGTSSTARSSPLSRRSA